MRGFESPELPFDFVSWRKEADVAVVAVCIQVAGNEDTGQRKLALYVRILTDHATGDEYGFCSASIPREFIEKVDCKLFLIL